MAGADHFVVRAIREADDHGRHTTTHRELLKLPNGGLVIDTPGMREIQLWDGGAGVGETFEDIAMIAQNCRFRDCQHRQEPGCAVREALGDGTLLPERLESFRKLHKELQILELKQNGLARLEEKRRMKGIAKAIKSIQKK